MSVLSIRVWRYAMFCKLFLASKPQYHSRAAAAASHNLS
jgi:hypothetical protein